VKPDGLRSVIRGVRHGPQHTAEAHGARSV
jgi:hypothetical protein